MKALHAAHNRESRDITRGNGTTRQAVGYIRVSTDMQALDGLSLDAQTAAIEQYCSMQGLKLVQIHKDVLSGLTDPLIYQTRPKAMRHQACSESRREKRARRRALRSRGQVSMAW